MCPKYKPSSRPAAQARVWAVDVDEKVHPEFSTIILDEAFDRADPAFTRQTMDVFRQFGFHMVLATPLKLIQTLSAYVGGTLVVSYTEEPDTDGHVRGTSHVTRIEMEDK